MSKINQVVREFLKYMEWTWEELSESSYRFIVPGHNGRWVCVLRWEKDSFIGCFSTCTTNVPARRRAAAAEYLMRATYNLRIGNFEMDYEDGEVAFKTSAPLDGIEPSMEFVKALAFANYSIMDRYLPGLISVAFGKASPKAAVGEAEKPQPKQEEGDDDDSEEDPQPVQPRPVRRAQSGADNNVRPPTERERREIRNRVPIPVGRGARIAQIAGFLKLMFKRRHEEAKNSCFANISPAQRVAPTNEVHRFIQFIFREEWFAIDLPNTAILPTEAQRVLGERRGFYREAERSDAGVTKNVNDLVQFDPIGKKYIYGDEREAAEDAAYLLFDVYDLPLDAELKVKASAFGDGPSWEKDQPLK